MIILHSNKINRVHDYCKIAIEADETEIDVCAIHADLTADEGTNRHVQMKARYETSKAKLCWWSYSNYAEVL